MKAQTRIRIDKVKEGLLSGEPIHEIVLKLSAEFGIAPSSMRYFLSRAYRELEGDMQTEKLMMQKLRSVMIQQQSNGLMATEQELDHYLTQIVRGEKPNERVVCTQDGMQIAKVAVGAADMLKIMQHLYYRIGYLSYGKKTVEPEQKTSARDIISFLKLMKWEDRE